MRQAMKSLLRLTGVEMLMNGLRYRQYQRSVAQWMRLDAQAAARFQTERLREIVAHAYDHVELYRNKWRRAGVHPRDIQSPADLARLPITTKDDFRHHFPSGILSTQCSAEDCFVLGTSGSTGSPVKVYLSLDRALIDFALSLPKFMAGMPSITLLSVLRDFYFRRNTRYMAIVVDEPSAYESLHSRVFWPMKHTVVNSLAAPDRHIREINRKRPQYVYSYPSTIRNICIAAGDQGIRMHRPQLIMVAGEVVDAQLRNLVQRTFGTDLLDVYGSIEFGFIACECLRHEGMHIFDWKVLLELLDDAGHEVPPGKSGQVVITDLFNRATPIIRYSGLGDYAVRKHASCSCGMRLPLLARVDGRRVDSIVLPDGQLVHPYSLTLALEDIHGLSKFQIRQERPDHVRVLLVEDKVQAKAGVSFAPESQAARTITDRFDRILKSQVRVELVTVDDIPRRPGAHKYATVVSKVERD
jgi:phenylacetate-CoA ligase